MDPNLTIGAKIKALRTEQKYTLKALSDLTGFSVGFLSQIERGISSVAVDSCLFYTSPSPRDRKKYRMPASA